MKVWGVNGATEWDADAEFKQGSAGVWYSWPGSAPEASYEILATASVAESAVGLKWLAGYNMQKHTITGVTWHSAASTTGILKNTAGTLSWADISHTHTYAAGNLHSHGISEAEHTHDIDEEGYHQHTFQRALVDTEPADGHTHEVHLAVTSGAGYWANTTYEDTHDHDGEFVAKAHDHSTPTGDDGYHQHTQT